VAVNKLQALALPLGELISGQETDSDKNVALNTSE